MKRISSSWTFVYKRLFPVFWFGFVLVFLGISFFVDMPKDAPPVPLFILPTFMLVIGYFIMRKFIFDLVDQVWDDGDSLLVINRGEEERIALANIKNVNYSPFISPRRAVLSLQRNTAFGNHIAFLPPTRFLPFATNPVVNDLIDRIDAARQQQA